MTMSGRATMLDRSLSIAVKEGIVLYISLQDLGLFILFIIIVVVCVYLIWVLHRMLGVLLCIRNILNDHNNDICEILVELPKSLKNVSELAVSLKNAVDQTGSAVEVLQSDFTDTVEDLRDGLETFAAYAKVIGEVFRAVFLK